MKLEIPVESKITQAQSTNQIKCFNSLVFWKSS